MFVRGVVDDEVHEDADAAAVGLAHELDEVSAGAEAPVDAVVVGDVVSVIPPRRRLERSEPDRRHTEAFEVVETPGEPFEVAAAVAVRVQVRLDVEAVDDRVLVPEVADHPSTSRSVRYIACDQRSGTAGSPHRSTHGL
jgi:hypothetical protein